MKLWAMILVLCLSGCYLANGSPSENEYWKKMAKKLLIKKENHA